MEKNILYEALYLLFFPNVKKTYFFLCRKMFLSRLWASSTPILILAQGTRSPFFHQKKTIDYSKINIKQSNQSNNKYISTLFVAGHSPIILPLEKQIIHYSKIIIKQSNQSNNKYISTLPLEKSVQQLIKHPTIFASRI